MSSVARPPIRAVAPLLLVLAFVGTRSAGAQQPTSDVESARSAAMPPAASGGVARDGTTALRLEPIVALPDTLTLAELARGVPLLLQVVTRDGRAVRTTVSWRVVTGESTCITADAGTNAEGFASATFGRVPLALANPGRVELEARTAASGAGPAATLRLSSVVVLRR